MRLLQDEKAEETTRAYTRELFSSPPGLYPEAVREDVDDNDSFPIAPDTCTVHVRRITTEDGRRHTKLTVSLRGPRVLCRRTGKLGATRGVRHEAYGWTDKRGADALDDWWPTPLGEASPEIRDFAIACYAHTKYPELFDENGRRKRHARGAFPVVGLDIPL